MLLKSILIQTARLRVLREFYESVLALTVENTSNTRISIRIGTSTLVMEEAKKTDPFYHFAINIPANKIEEARSWLLDRKVELLWIDDYKSDIADLRNWHAKSIYFFDPAENIVELIARFDLNNETNEAFSSTQFLGISEIGLVFPQNEIDQQVERIMQETGISYFAKQPPMEQFKVLGNDEGLFIIVTENRNWYPTNNPSGIFPIEIQFENGGKSEVLKY